MLSIDDLIDYHPSLDIRSDTIFHSSNCDGEIQSNFEDTDHIQNCLTSPSEPVGNNGWDNSNGDLICYKDMELFDQEGHQFILKAWLGQGQFGQVYECEVANQHSYFFSTPRRNHHRYAVKISKASPEAINQFSYESQALLYV